MSSFGVLGFVSSFNELVLCIFFGMFARPGARISKHARAPGRARVALRIRLVRLFWLCEFVLRICFVNLLCEFSFVNLFGKCAL